MSCIIDADKKCALFLWRTVSFLVCIISTQEVNAKMYIHSAYIGINSIGLRAEVFRYTDTPLHQVSPETRGIGLLVKFYSMVYYALLI